MAHKMKHAKWPKPGTLFAIPLGSDAWALGQILPVAHEVGVIDRVFRRLPMPADIEPSAERAAAVACVLSTGFDENGWVVVGRSAFVDAFRKSVLRWEIDGDGYRLGEWDPFDPGSGEETYVDQLPAVADPDSPEHHEITVPPLLAAYLQDRWGLPRVPFLSDIALVEVSPRDELLDHSAVAELREDSESDPKRGRTRLVGSAREAFAADGFLDSEIGTPALVAACATKDAKMARAFRATPKSLAKLVPNAKAVASRVLDPKTSELAQLHEESGTLAALVAYVDGLALE